MERPGNGQEAARGDALGAYGLRVAGLPASARDLLVPAGLDWPEIALSADLGRASTSVDILSEHHAQLRLRNGGQIEIERTAGTAVVRTPAPVDAQELVHPYLAPIAAVLARWIGRESFHAGAFAVDGGVWGVMGEREAGKSTTLGELARRGLPIVCDDMLVLEGVAAFAGPRVLDLRREAAEHLGMGEGLGVVGARERWRARVAQAPAGLPLRGWVFLSWGDEIAITRVPPAERLGRIAAQQGLRIPSADPAALLELASLPTWEVARPAGLGSLAEAADRLLDVLAR